jgi:hypothetical protein
MKKIYRLGIASIFALAGAMLAPGMQNNAAAAPAAPYASAATPASSGSLAYYKYHGHRYAYRYHGHYYNHRRGTPGHWSYS